MKAILTILMLVLVLPACSLSPIQPWERDLLAKPSMALVPDEMDNALDEHIYFSKEGSLGGQGVGGGGCGCN